MKKIILYHYSNKDFSGRISPEFFGDNAYTNNSGNLSGIKRVYFYTEAGKREVYLFGAKYLYTAEISASALYDIEADKKGIIPGLAGRDIYAVLKSKGYAGALGNNGYICAALFKAVKIKSKKALTS